ncbi:MAG: hypothetical protein RBS23_00270 [Mariniphaga sp.]|jgi:hypothetical protein|nr:hypothetical protein [Mariniphaga sp.]
MPGNILNINPGGSIHNLFQSSEQHSYQKDKTGVRLWHCNIRNILKPHKIIFLTTDYQHNTTTKPYWIDAGTH